MAPTVTVSGIAPTNSGSSPGAHNSTTTTTLVMKPTAESLTSITAHRRKRLVRSENVCCSHHQGWEAIFRESLLHMAWPISMSLSSDQTDSLAMTDFLPLKIRSVFIFFLIISSQYWPSWLRHQRFNNELFNNLITLLPMATSPSPPPTSPYHFLPCVFARIGLWRLFNILNERFTLGVVLRTCCCFIWWPNFVLKTGRKQRKSAWASYLTWRLSFPILFCFLDDDAYDDTSNFQRNIHVQNPYFLISPETLCLSLFCISFCKIRRRRKNNNRLPKSAARW